MAVPAPARLLCLLCQQWSQGPNWTHQSWPAAPSLPLRMPPRHFPFRAPPAWHEPSGHRSPLLRAPSLHLRVAKAQGSSPAHFESPRGCPGVPSLVLKVRRQRSPQFQGQQKQARPLPLPPVLETRPPAAVAPHLVAGQWLNVWKLLRATSRRTRAP